jgi:hypothetical protein
LFHKTAFKFTKNESRILLLLAACIIGTGVQYASAQTAQEPSRTEPNPSDSRQLDAEQGKYRTVDILQQEQNGTQPQEAESDPSDPMNAIPIPIAEKDEGRSLGGQPFLDDVFQSSKNRWGFSLSAYQAYTSDISSENQPKQSSGITAFMPRTFFNFGRRKSLFHMDIGGGYRKYNQRQLSSAWDYYGNAYYTYRASKGTVFQLSNQFTSSFNDAWSFLSLYSPLDYDPLSSNVVLFNRQRINRNAFQAKLDYQITPKARFEVFGGHRWYDYQRNTLRNSSALEYGGSFNYRLTKWLHVSSSMTSYYNMAGTNFPDAQIYHIQIGGLDFRLSDSWRIWAGGGFDFSDYEDQNRTAEHISAGIGYTATKTSFSVTYQRGFTSAIGLSRLLMSDVASANVGRRITNWLNANLQAYYYRSNEAGTSGWLETLSGGGGLEFALRRDLVMTMNAFYQNQRSRRFSVDGLGLSRLTGYFGLQYVWPAKNRGDY